MGFGCKRNEIFCLITRHAIACGCGIDLRHLLFYNNIYIGNEQGF